MTGTYPTIENIIGLVSEETGIEPRFILGESRVLRIARARQMVMFLAREHTDFSYPRIANALHRDHSTVMHGVRAIYDLSYTDDDLVKSLTKIRARIREGVRSQAAPKSIAPFLSKTQKSSPEKPRRPFMRHRHLYHYGKPKSDTPTKERKCLRCREVFISSGPGNHVCWCCRSETKNHGIPEHYIGTVL